MNTKTTIWTFRRNTMLGTVIALAAAVLFAGCTAPSGQSTMGRGTATGAGLGAALGAGAGLIAGNNIKGVSKTEGAVAGAVVGGVLGGVMGNQRDAAARQNTAVNQRLNSVEQQANTTVINIANSNGSTTPVVLHRSGNQWIGPRGEAYNNLPTEAQLRPVYGF